PDDSSHTCHSKKNRKYLWIFGLVSAVSALWLLIRTGNKPSRIVYPCQQAAVTNIELFKLSLLAALPSVATIRSRLAPLKPIGVITVLLVGSAFITSETGLQSLGFYLAQEYDRVPLELQENVATTSEHTSDVFLAQCVTGEEGDTTLGLSALFEIMADEGLHFYNTTTEPSGLIESNDVIILKVNSQWSYRGGTNTDLVKAVVDAIIAHPEGFTGEIVIADSGQGIGNLDRVYSNAFDNSQSFEDVAQQYSMVSTDLWDEYHYDTVDDYDMGDFEEGYVRSSIWNADTEIYTSYPKFTTDSGLYISFKNGVWDNTTGWDSNRLKVINMPVLKSHMRYGVTSCVKHYMGVPQGYIVPSVDENIPHEHFSIARGGMGTLMVETRMPILNILDMIWVNAHTLNSSMRGPWSRYFAASFTDIIGASRDPVALDYWASKNILIPTSEYLGYTDVTSIDPDYAPVATEFYGEVGMDESFHNYLNRSKVVLENAGFQVTMDTAEMNVFVTIVNQNATLPTGSDFQIDPLLLAIAIPLSAILIVGAVVV
ncbi:MAG: DUF362 domain-containing protein, partial [Candidatus Thorarchaeota archaeon]